VIKAYHSSNINQTRHCVGDRRRREASIITLSRCIMHYCRYFQYFYITMPHCSSVLNVWLKDKTTKRTTHI